jgi:hypothetical protein
MASKKKLIPGGGFVKDYEAMVPFQTLVMVGHTVHTVCPAHPKWIRKLLDVLGSTIIP